MYKALFVAFLVVNTAIGGVAAPPEASIVRLDPALDAIVPAGAKLELLKDGFRDGLEGGVWIRNGGYLLFSNKAEQEITKWTPDGKFSVYLDLGEISKSPDPKVTLSSGTVLDQQGRLVYTSLGERAVYRVEPDGKRTILADTFQGKRFVHPNDLVYKSDGTLYFTDNGAGPPGVTDPPGHTVYMLQNGQVRLVTTGQVEHPNGIAISPDEKFLYVNDSGNRQVWRFALQPDGSVTGGRVWVDMSSDKSPGVPDGMKVDKKGNVYDSGPGGVWILSPEGKHLGTLSFLPERATNLAFGGSDGKTLFLVNHTSLYRIRLNVEGMRP